MFSHPHSPKSQTCVRLFSKILGNTWMVHNDNVFLIWLNYFWNRINAKLTTEIFYSSRLKRCEVPYLMTWAHNAGIKIIKRDYTTQHPNQIQIICCTHKKNITVLPLDYYYRDQKWTVNKENFLVEHHWVCKEMFWQVCYTTYPWQLCWQAFSVSFHKNSPCQFLAKASYCI